MYDCALLPGGMVEDAFRDVRALLRVDGFSRVDVNIVSSFLLRVTA